MRIIAEAHEDERYIDIVLDDEELEDVFAYTVLSQVIKVQGKKFNIGIRRKVKGDEEYEEE